jgi:hypothetical protein
MKNFLQVIEKDYLPMNLFSLEWRFSDQNHNVLPKDKLSKITPLNQEAAFRMHENSMPLIKNFHLDNDKFQEIQKLNNAHESTITRQWLSERIPTENTKIIVSWDKENCVIVHSEVFCEYWDDFCYPSSDDVVIFPLRGKWVLYYFHEDQFQFGYKISGR